MPTTELNKPADAQSRSMYGLGAFVCEKFAVWYDGTGGYTPGYCRNNGVTLFDSEDRARDWILDTAMPSLVSGYHVRKLLLHEAPSGLPLSNAGLGSAKGEK